MKTQIELCPKNWRLTQVNEKGNGIDLYTFGKTKNENVYEYKV